MSQKQHQEIIKGLKNKKCNLRGSNSSKSKQTRWTQSSNAVVIVPSSPLHHQQLEKKKTTKNLLTLSSITQPLLSFQAMQTRNSKLHLVFPSQLAKFTARLQITTDNFLHDSLKQGAFNNLLLQCQAERQKEKEKKKKNP